MSDRGLRGALPTARSRIKLSTPWGNQLGFVRFACPLAAGFPTLASNVSNPCECVAE